MNESAQKATWVTPVLQEIPMVDTAVKGAVANEATSMMVPAS
jgi:hypothetical protein